MIEIECIVLEDGLEYAIVDEIEIDNEKKLIVVTDEEEIKKTMMSFAKKHRNDFA